MHDNGVEWLAPSSLEEALELRGERADDATVVAGGTFLAILMNQGFIAPAALLTLRNVPDLSYIGIDADGTLRLGAMTTHRAVERADVVRRGWPALADVFAVVGNLRVRNQATVGGVLADADYASDPPSMLTALDACVVARSARKMREIPVAELITGYYETSLEPDELIVEVRVPPLSLPTAAGSGTDRAAYRKFRSRSSEDRPCVSVAAVRRAGALRVAVGAVADRPQYFPEVCALAEGAPLDHALATDIGRRYAEAIDPISDARGSARYRRRVIAVEVRRALEELTQ